MDYSLSDNDLLKALDNKCNIIKYSDMVHVKNIDQLLKNYNCCIILYEEKPYIGHWCVLTKNKNTIEFFDSYGMKPDQYIYDLTPSERETLNAYPYLSKLLLNSDYKLTFNEIPLQAKKNNVNTCGRWALLRSIFYDVDLYKFCNFFKNNQHYDPDTLAYLLTKNLF